MFPREQRRSIFIFFFGPWDWIDSCLTPTGEHYLGLGSRVSVVYLVVTLDASLTFTVVWNTACSWEHRHGSNSVNTDFHLHGSLGTFPTPTSFMYDIWCVDTNQASVWSSCIWRGSLIKQNEEICWHFESGVHRRCCLHCAENIRAQQPVAGLVPGNLTSREQGGLSSPLRISSSSAAAVWVWLCTSCSERPALTLSPWGTSGLFL